MQSLSWDGMVELYNETRIFDEGCFAAALDYVQERLPPSAWGRVLEPGVGNGRIALPLAERGYDVTGCDISGEMLAGLTRRLDARTAGHVAPLAADVCDLPFATASFDWAVAVHLFYFIPDWQRAVAELLRVVRRDGTIVLMHTGTGAEVPWLNERYKALCAAAGHRIAGIGARSTGDVLAYYESHGCQVEQVRDLWHWTARLPVARAIDYLAARAYSFTIAVPEAVHEAAIASLRREAAAMPGGADAVAAVPNQVYLALVTR